jgi:hypothetical protein
MANNSSSYNRRDALRLFGGATSGAVLIGASSGLLSPASAAKRRLKTLVVTASLNKSTYEPGERMTLSVTENIGARRRIRISDSTGAAWSKISDDGQTARFRAVAVSRTGSAQVRATVKRITDGATSTAEVPYVIGTATGGAVAGARFVGDRDDRLMLGMCVTDKSTSNLRWENAMNLLGAAGGYVSVRRCFIPGWITKANVERWADWAETNGVYPVISFKVPNNNWAGVANGNYDADLDLLISVLKSRAQAGRAPVCVAVHHEPAGDGDLSVWARMQEYLSNYFAPHNKVFCFTTISNGYDWGPHRGGKGEVEKQYPPSLIAALNRNGHILACDTYDSADPTKLSYSLYDRTSLKMNGFIEWARAKGVKLIGLGEFGCHDAEDLQRCWNLIAQNSDIFAYAAYFNSGQNSRADWRMIPDGYPPDPAVTSYVDQGGTAKSQAKLDFGKKMFNGVVGARRTA